MTEHLLRFKITSELCVVCALHLSHCKIVILERQIQLLTVYPQLYTINDTLHCQLYLINGTNYAWKSMSMVLEMTGSRCCLTFVSRKLGGERDAESGEPDALIWTK